MKLRWKAKEAMQEDGSSRIREECRLTLPLLFRSGADSMGSMEEFRRTAMDETSVALNSSVRNSQWSLPASTRRSSLTRGKAAEGLNLKPNVGRYW